MQDDIVTILKDLQQHYTITPQKLMNTVAVLRDRAYRKAAHRRQYRNNEEPGARPFSRAPESKSFLESEK